MNRFALLVPPLLAIPHLANAQTAAAPPNVSDASSATASTVTSPDRVGPTASSNQTTENCLPVANGTEQRGPTRPAPLDAVGIQFAVGSAAALVTVPVMITIGSRVGEGGDLVPALLAVAIPYIVLVPLAVTGAQSLVANRLQPRSGYGGWAATATTLATVGLMAAGHAMGVSGLNGSTLAGFTVLNALVLPAISTTVMYFASPRPCDRAAHLSRCNGTGQIFAGGIPFTDSMGITHVPVLAGTF